MDPNDYSTDNSRKRMAEESHEVNIFGRSKKVLRIPSKPGRGRDEDKLDTLMNMILEMKQDLKEEINKGEPS